MRSKKSKMSLRSKRGMCAPISMKSKRSMRSKREEYED